MDAKNRSKTCENGDGNNFCVPRRISSSLQYNSIEIDWRRDCRSQIWNRTGIGRAVGSVTNCDLAKPRKKNNFSCNFGFTWPIFILFGLLTLSWWIKGFRVFRLENGLKLVNLLVKWCFSTFWLVREVWVLFSCCNSMGFCSPDNLLAPVASAYVVDVRGEFVCRNRWCFGWDT